VFLCVGRRWCYTFDVLNSCVWLAFYDLVELDINGLRSEVLGSPRGGRFSIGIDFSHSDRDLRDCVICLLCRNRDFQQLNGRNVVVGVAIMLCY